jgi:hypothetical protein
MCLSSDGGEAQCAHGDNCCSQGMGKATAGSCAATCTAPAYALDCTGNTGTNECGAGTVCCATLVIDGGVVGDCTIAELSSSCQASCADDLPGTTCGSPEDPLTFTLRLCTATADCASDDSRTSCCAYEDSPIYWCVSDRALTTDCKP